MILVIAYATGVISVLSPCILPLLPIIVGGSIQKNRFAPLLIAIGVVLTYACLSVLLSFSQTYIDVESIDQMGAVIFIVIGLILLIKPLHDLVGKFLLTPLTRLLGQSPSLKNYSHLGYLFMGASLGIAWAPCIGSSFGIVVGAAINNNQPLLTFLLFLTYSLGIVTPILLIGYGFKSVLLKNRMLLMKLSVKSTMIFGIISLFVGIVLLFKIDQIVGAYFLM